MRSLGQRLAIVIAGVFFSTAALSVPPGLCGFERGYQVCHAMSAKLNRVNLSFAPDRIITIRSYQAMVCSTNPSGVKRAHGELAQQADANVFEVEVESHSDSCTNLTRLNFTHDGAWQVTIEFNDGDVATFYINVVDWSVNP